MKTPFRIALAATTALGLVTPAVAQDASGRTDADIVVTARRVEERLQDVPISITVFNQEQLSNRNVTNAQDLANYTPSLSATTGFGSENSTYSLRGFVQEIGTAPSVGVYFADVVAPRGPSQGFPAGDGAGPGMFFDLQNVQVLKGPQGTLFGRNTTGGAVLLVPQKPTDEFEGYIEGSLGNYDMRRIQAVVNVPLTEGIRLRLGGEHQKRDGFMKNVIDVGPRDYDNINYVALRASLVVDVTPDVENYTVASYINSDNNGHISKVIACNPAHPFALVALQACGNVAAQDAKGFYYLHGDMPDAYQKTRTWQIINNTKWQVTDDLTVRNIISYAHLWTKTKSSLFGTRLGLQVAPTVFVPFAFASIRHIPDGHSSNQATFTEEFRLEGSAGEGRLNYQTGVYYENATPKGLIGSQSPTFIGCSNPDALVCTNLLGTLSAINYTAAKNSFRSTGVYAQATYALTDQFKVTGGFRYTWDKVKSFSRRISYYFPQGVFDASPLPISMFDPANPTAIASQTRCTDFTVRVPPNCDLNEERSFSAPTWLVGVDYNPTPDILLYAKYMRGYRTGNIKSDVPIEFHVTEPEKVDTYEIGLKASFDGAVRGNFNIAAFYNNFRNQQLQLGFNVNQNRTDPVTGASLPTISVPGNAGPVNVGKSRIWGIEVDGRLQPFEGFALDAGYTYLNTEVLDVVPATLPSDNVYFTSATVREGDPLILSPKHRLTVTGTYTLPLDESIGEISLGATYTYTSSQLGNYTRLRFGLVTQPDGTIFDSGLLAARNLLNLNFNWNGIGGGPFDLAVFVTNVTGEKYYTSMNGLITGIGAETATVAEPRMFGARVKFRFGGMAD